mmetsp:Transcript_42377/g.49527  ORF Transcript_42377/g.49527 Transcript_42377/m.49527 type:complete len:370 (-) Transcript_42377:423-1532(-)
MDSISLYDILGVSSDATTEEVRSSYKALAKSLHPDKNKFGTELFKQINEAQEVLSDTKARKNYDRSGLRVHTEKRTASTNSKQESKKPKPSPNVAKDKNEQDEKKSTFKEDFLISATCMVCGYIVDKAFYEASCCNALCCEECANQENSNPHREKPTTMKCLNKLCTNPLNTMIRSSGEFINAQIDNLTTTHVCGKRIDNDGLTKHKLICPKLNAPCLKCSGKGKYTTVECNEITCDACNGRKCLAGLDWTKCFKCNGRGAYDTTSGTTEICSTCQNKGALNGKWTMCFKCHGAGAYDTDNQGRINCAACTSLGAFKGFNLGECSACSGVGCLGCQWKGCVPCECGPSCSGHFTSRFSPYNGCFVSLLY